MSCIVIQGPPIVQTKPEQFALFGHAGSVECFIEKEPKADVFFKKNLS